MTDKPTVTLQDTRIVQTILGIMEAAVPIQTFELFQGMIAVHREAAIKEAELQTWAESKALWYYGIKWENLEAQSKVSLLQEARAFLTSAKGSTDD